MDQQQLKDFIKNAVSVKSPAFIRRLCWEKLFIIIALFGLLSTQAHAASFDCNKAASWLEKTVCSNPELSKLDEQLAKAYHDALASLSPEGQKETKQYQRQRLKEISYIKAYYDKYFTEHKEYARYHDEIILSDLRRAYEKRIKQLQQSLIKFPDRIFRNVCDIHWETDEACPGEIASKELTYPQIENPRDENEKFWNTLVSQKARNDLKRGDGCTSTYVEYNVIFSNKHVISLINGTTYAPLGSGRAFQSTSSVCWLLEAKRELQTSDLFDDKTGWRAKLAALAPPKLKKEEIADEETFEITPSRLMEIVTSADHWVILEDGLGIQFRQYELGSRAIAFITIDWKALNPYLSKNGRSLISD